MRRARSFRVAYHPGSRFSRRPVHSDGEFQLDVTIPANTTATVFIPAKSAADISESDLRLDRAERVDVLREEGNLVILAIQSGRYRFRAR